MWWTLLICAIAIFNFSLSSWAGDPFFVATPQSASQGAQRINISQQLQQQHGDWRAQAASAVEVQDSQMLYDVLFAHMDVGSTPLHFAVRHLNEALSNPDCESTVLFWQKEEHRSKWIARVNLWLKITRLLLQGGTASWGTRDTSQRTAWQDATEKAKEIFVLYKIDPENLAQLIGPI